MHSFGMETIMSCKFCSIHGWMEGLLTFWHVLDGILPWPCIALLRNVIVNCTSHLVLEHCMPPMRQCDPWLSHACSSWSCPMKNSNMTVESRWKSRFGIHGLGRERLNQAWKLVIWSICGFKHHWLPIFLWKWGLCVLEWEQILIWRFGNIAWIMIPLFLCIWFYLCMVVVVEVSRIIFPFRILQVNMRHGSILLPYKIWICNQLFLSWSDNSIKFLLTAETLRWTSFLESRCMKNSINLLWWDQWHMSSGSCDSSRSQVLKECWIPLDGKSCYNFTNIHHLQKLRHWFARSLENRPHPSPWHHRSWDQSLPFSHFQSKRDFIQIWWRFPSSCGMIGCMNKCCPNILHAMFSLMPGMKFLISWEKMGICEWFVVGEDWTLIMHYIIMHERNHDGDMDFRIHFVLGLHGGVRGPKSNTEAFVKAKNGMATMLLGLGCDLKEVSMFVERIVSAAGPSAVEQITKMSESHAQIHALQSLSKTLNMTMPQIDKSSHQRGKIVQKTLAKKTPIEVIINPSDYQVTEDFFYNQDDTPCLQKESIRGSSTGFTLMDGESAMPWISSSQPMSADELGVVIIGSCPSKVTSGCNRVKVPMYNKQGQPLIMDCCLHQLGSKDIKIKTPKQVDVKVSDSRVMAVTIFQDEVEQRVWEQMTKSPIKTIFEILNGLDLQINLPSPPWGRSWRNRKGPCHPEAAESFQCHMRVLAGDFREMLCVSGQAGLYTTPKDEKHHVDTSFGIIWIDIAIDTLKVQASAYPSNRGLVKVVKGRSAKISRGVRVYVLIALTMLKHTNTSNHPKTFLTWLQQITLQSWHRLPLEPMQQTFVTGWSRWNGQRSHWSLWEKTRGSLDFPPKSMTSLSNGVSHWCC